MMTKNINDNRQHIASHRISEEHGAASQRPSPAALGTRFHALMMRRRRVLAQGGAAVALLLLLCVLLVFVGCPDNNNGTSDPISFTTVAVGGAHTCAIDTSSNAYCWGNGSNGQLGYGDVANSATPQQVFTIAGGNLVNVSAISAGAAHTCAVITNGIAYCWGNGDNGRLGNGDILTYAFPKQVVDVVGTGTLANVSAISAGGSHTCAVDTSGNAYCWGKGESGQLGSGSIVDSNTPQLVIDAGGTGTLANVSAISAGASHTCAVDVSGNAYCWGNGGSGRLGNGDEADSSTPQQVVGVEGAGTLANVSAISAGASHTCAVDTNGSAYCWGLAVNGQLGNGSLLAKDTPQQIFGVAGSGTVPADVDIISAGGSHTCAVDVNGNVYCWGNGGSGQLGIDSTTDSNIPQSVFSADNSSTIFTTGSVIGAGGFHSCAVDTGGTISCWGKNDSGQMGNGSTTGSNTPQPIAQ